MKRSEVNRAIQQATAYFKNHHWALPPNPRWDVTDFGLGDFEKTGLVLVNLAEEPEYCEKLMFAMKGQQTPVHTHRIKKEDIICRSGKLAFRLWQGTPGATNTGRSLVKKNGEKYPVIHGEEYILQSGERLTITPGLYHTFYPVDGPCIIGEVSTANDDEHDNIFADPEVGRFSEIIEDEPPIAKLVHEI